MKYANHSITIPLPGGLWEPDWDPPGFRGSAVLLHRDSGRDEANWSWIKAQPEPSVPTLAS